MLYPGLAGYGAGGRRRARIALMISAVEIKFISAPAAFGSNAVSGPVPPAATTTAAS